MSSSRKIRVVVAKPGLDGHDRGAKIIARALRDAGMEVIYTGLHQTPEQIVETVIQEDADAVGLSILSGAHMTLVPRIAARLKAEGAEDVVLVVGGTIPSDDIPELKELGVAEVFTPGAPVQGIVDFLREAVPGLAAGPWPDRPPPAFAVRAVIGARRGLMALADRLVPAHVALFDQSVGMGRTHVIGTLAELGVADELAEGPATAEELARPAGRERRRAAPRDARRGARAGCSSSTGSGAFSLGRTGQALRSDHPTPIRDWARYFSLKSTSAAWADLTETVRTGRASFPRVNGSSVWSWFGEHPDEERLFAGGDAQPHRAGRALHRPRLSLAGRRACSATWPAAWARCSARSSHARPGLRGVLVDGPASWPRPTAGSRGAACASGWSSPRATSSSP